MPSLLLTLFVGFLGVVSLAFGFLYGQDFPKYRDLDWFDVLKEELPLRAFFWAVGAAFLAWGGYFQFSHFA